MTVDMEETDWRLPLGFVLWMIGLFSLLLAVQQRNALKTGGNDKQLNDYFVTSANVIISSAIGVIFCLSGSISFAMCSLRKNS